MYAFTIPWWNEGISDNDYSSGSERKKKLTFFVKNYMNPNVKALYIISGTNLPIGKTCGNDALTFGNYLSREWVTITRTSKWLFGGIKTVLDSPEVEEMSNLMVDLIILYHCFVSRVM